MWQVANKRFNNNNNKCVLLLCIEYTSVQFEHFCNW